MKFQSVKLCLVVSAAISFVACQNQIQSRQANQSNGIPVRAVAQAQLLDASGTLDDFLKSEMKIEDIKAAVEKLSAELSEKADANLDEELDAEELEELVKLEDSDLNVSDIKAKVDALDLDKDGKISTEEMALVMTKWQEKIKAAKEKHKESFAEKRKSFCDQLQDRIVKAKDDKFLEAILLKNGLAKCAGVIADEDSDEVVAPEPTPTSTPDPADEEEEEVVVDVVAPTQPPAPVDTVCKNVNTIKINITQDAKSLVEILIKICQK